MRLAVRKLLAIVLVLTVPSCSHGDIPEHFRGFDVSRPAIPLADVQRGGPPKDGIPALTDPATVPASEASDMGDDDRVLGVVVDGAARAYPLAILTWHELVNDAVGDTPILISYCPLCGSAVVFDRRVDGRTLEFGVSGLLWESNVLMYDRTNDALWSQLRMAAVTGPRAGTALTPLPVALSTWRAWRRRHPATTVLSRDTGHRRDYDRDPYAGYDDTPRLMFPVSRADARRPVKDWVAGVRVGAVAKAYPFAELARAAQPLRDSVAGRALIVEFDPETQTVHVTDVAGTPYPTAFAYWFAWSAFFPETTLFAAP